MRGTAYTSALNFRCSVPRTLLLNSRLELPAKAAASTGQIWALDTKRCRCRRQICMHALSRAARTSVHAVIFDDLMLFFFWHCVYWASWSQLCRPTVRPRPLFGIAPVELADIVVGLARACSIMHANASSGRPRREETTPPTTYLILPCPPPNLRNPGLYTLIDPVRWTSTDLNGWIDLTSRTWLYCHASLRCRVTSLSKLFPSKLRTQRPASGRRCELLRLSF